ncbi:MAG: hypothetical protein QXW97_02615 [Candidatus Pacearchaeota archaeon]
MQINEFINELGKRNYEKSKKLELYDVRKKNIDDEDINKISEKISEKIKEENQNIILISGDGRINTPYIMNKLAKIFLQNKIKILDAGHNNLTQTIEYATRKYNTSAVTITASHQPSEYNGFKIAFQNKYSVLKNNKNLESLIQQSWKNVKKPDIYYVQSNLNKDYSEIITEKFKHLKKGPKINFLYDAMQGISFHYFKDIMSNLKLNSFDAVRQYPNAYFNMDYKNEGPDPLKKVNFELLKKNIDVNKLKNYDFIAIVDGDGDRFGLAVNNELIDSPIITAVRAKYLLEKFKKNNTKRKEKPAFVAEYCLYAMINEYLKNEIDIFPVKRGRPSHIEKILELKEDRAVLGGSEISLHNYNEEGIDDGIETTLLFYEIVQKEKKDGLMKRIDEAKKGLKKSHEELRIKTEKENKKIIQDIVEHYKSYEKYKDFNDAIFKINETEFLVHASNNDPNEIAIISFGDNLKEILGNYEQLYETLNEIEKDLGNKLNNKVKNIKWN